MTDQHPEATAIELGGRKRFLKFGFKAYRLAEKKGVDIHPAELLNPPMALVPRLVYAGLLTDEPDLDENLVLDWMDAAPDQVLLTTTVLHAFRDSQSNAGKLRAAARGNVARPGKAKS